jgi:putative transposase
MPRRSRVSTGRFIFHVLNRAIQGATLFEQPADYEAFLELLAEALRQHPVNLLPYCVMPNHWHLVLWPQNDGALSTFMARLTSKHARQWRDARGTRGRGAVYQSRFKAIAVQHDRHFLRLCRYVERNAARARLAARPAEWPWCSASPMAAGANRPVLSPWPVPRQLDRTARQAGAHAGAPRDPVCHPSGTALRLDNMAADDRRSASMAERPEAAREACFTRSGPRLVRDGR